MQTVLLFVGIVLLCMKILFEVCKFQLFQAVVLVAVYGKSRRARSFSTCIWWWKYFISSFFNGKQFSRTHRIYLNFPTKSIVYCSGCAENPAEWLKFIFILRVMYSKRVVELACVSNRKKEREKELWKKDHTWKLFLFRGLFLHKPMNTE